MQGGVAKARTFKQTYTRTGIVWQFHKNAAALQKQSGVC